MDCEITACGSSAIGIYVAGGTGNHIVRCWIHDNACSGIVTGTSVDIQCCLITNNTGASSDGISATYSCSITNNTISGNGRHGIANNTQYNIGWHIRNNIVANHTAGGAAGILFNATGPMPASPFTDGNAFYNNTPQRSNGDKHTGVSGVTRDPVG